MIPTERQIKKLWNVYHLPPSKQRHCVQVWRLARSIASQLRKANPSLDINMPLLEAATLLHDIDKMAPKLPGEHHPDAAVRILREHEFDEVADVVRTHPLHAILDQSIAPKTMEQKLLFLADKMVKNKITGVDERFALWHAENLPKEALRILNEAYPKVKKLEKEIAKLAKVQDFSTMKLR